MAGEQVIELGERLGWFGHADLGGQLLVVEDTGQAVVETHGIERAGAAGAVCPDPVLVKLWHRPLVPAECRGVVVEVHEQAVLGERDHRRQPDQVGRVVAREQARRRVDEIRELVLLDVPGHVRELLCELLGEREGDVESGLEVGVEHNRIRPAVRECGGWRLRRRSGWALCGGNLCWGRDRCGRSLCWGRDRCGGSLCCGRGGSCCWCACS